MFINTGVFAKMVKSTNVFTTMVTNRVNMFLSSWTFFIYVFVFACAAEFFSRFGKLFAQ